MNHREPTQRPIALRRGLQCLAFVLSAVVPQALPAAARQRTASGPSAERSSRESAGYLTSLGAPPLRFVEIAPPPDVTTRPAAAAPPQPALTVTESSVAMANAAAAQSVSVHTTAPELPVETKVESPAPAPAAAEKPTPSAILPDETRPEVRPEDFLPFFQIPGSPNQPGGMTLVVPVPRNAPPPPPLPVSSATYNQK